MVPRLLLAAANAELAYTPAELAVVNPELAYEPAEAAVLAEANAELAYEAAELAVAVGKTPEAHLLAVIVPSGICEF